MSKDLNKASIIGRLGADPELRYTGSGKAVTNIRVATNRKFGDEETTDWHSVVLWEKQAEAAANFLNKGDRVYIEGRITYRKYENKDGNEVWVTEIVSENMIMLGTGRASEDGDDAAPRQQRSGGAGRGSGNRGNASRGNSNGRATATAGASAGRGRVSLEDLPDFGEE